MPEVYPYEVPEGYKEGMSGGSYDPITGERKSWAQPPQRIALPPPDLGMQDINREALNNALKSAKVDEALKAVDAAVKFQAQQRYQRKLEAAIREPDPTKQAALKAAAGVAEFPIMFGGAGAGSAIRATTPPTITPQNAAVNAISKSRLEELARHNKEMEKARTAAAEKATIIHNKGEVIRVSPDGKIQTLKKAPIQPPKPVKFTEELTEDVPATPATPEIPAEKKYGPFSIDWLAKDQPYVAAQPAMPARKKGRYVSEIPATPAESNVTTKEQFDALDPGSVYTGKDGKKYRKP